LKNALILLTNDDGFYSDGISSLLEHLKHWGDAYIVAPDQEKSATSLALTLHHPLRVKKIKKNVFAVDGTPADCVYLAVQKLLPRRPDIVISGLNHGPNLGQQDISYSGTVAGALQGAFLGIPSMAVSVLPNEKGEFAFDFSAGIARAAAEILLKGLLPPKITLNINIPPPPLKGTKITTLGEKRYNPEIVENTDPRHRLYYWIGTGNPRAMGGEESDVMTVKKGYITVTPIHRDLTDYASLKNPDFKRLFQSLSKQGL
jgi:5'-nucleotidase